MKHHTYINLQASRCEYESLPNSEWRKDYFDEITGGYVATHLLKERDNPRRSGIAAEVKACLELALMGKHVLRLPENIPELIDKINILGNSYRDLLKFKPGETNPRGYPDAYFDGQTWDFKITKSKNEDTLRQIFKDGRKADNIVFVVSEWNEIVRIKSAIGREYGSRKENKSWVELPNVYYLLNNQLLDIWVK